LVTTITGLAYERAYGCVEDAVGVSMAWPTRLLIRALQAIGGRFESGEQGHLKLGRLGETEAYLYLQKLGYRIVATNFRVPQNRGEIDLVGWDGNVRCFIEVKTRTDASFAPPSAAVTREKQEHIISVARRYVRRLPGGRPPSCRFDIVSVISSGHSRVPIVTLRKGAFSWEQPVKGERSYWEFDNDRGRRKPAR
jgi:putative endonuclease